MLDLSKYQSLGEALRDAVERWADEVCLVEDDRGREKPRLTYRDYKAAALPLAKALQDAGLAEASRASIIMTNQSKWLISAYAIFHSGGVLVPLDFKLTAPEQIALLKHSQASVLITEYFLWRNIVQAGGLGDTSVKLVLVTEAPPNADLAGAHSAGSGQAQRWEEFKAEGEPVFVPRQRSDWASIVYSSGTGGRPKGCVMTHENYLEQCIALTAWYPFWPGVRYLSILPTNHAIDFMVGFIGPFTCGACVVHLRTLRPEFVREAFARHHITYVSLVPLVVKSLEKGLRERFAQLPTTKRVALKALVAVNRALTRQRPARRSAGAAAQVHKLRWRAARHDCRRGLRRALHAAFLYDLGIPVVNGYGLTEAGTAVTVTTCAFRADTVGKPLPGWK
jgi:long-chain acyl-CoA synthetase